MQIKSIVLGAAAAAIVTLFAGSVQPADAKNGDVRTLLRCRVIGDNNVVMHARYDARRGRQKFSAETTSNPLRGSGIVAGSVMTVTIDGQAAGTEVFVPTDTGRLVADLNLDTKPNGADTKPFPASLVVQAGSTVEVSINTNPVRTLGCDLQ